MAQGRQAGSITAWHVVGVLMTCWAAEGSASTWQERMRTVHTQGVGRDRVLIQPDRLQAVAQSRQVRQTVDTLYDVVS